MARRPRDKRGYPIPWNITIGNDGTPLFIMNDMEKHLRAIRGELCPLCGERLGKWRWFTGGPLSAFDPHGAYFDLPGHHECEQYALQVCPWLSAPNYSSLIAADKIPHRDKIPDHMTGIDPTMMPGRPPLFVSVASDRMDVRPGEIQPIVIPARPYLGIEYWQLGKQLTEAEALPFLRYALGEDCRPPALRG